jgi:glycosyltransferase involved in cell wall biosynthesis
MLEAMACRLPCVASHTGGNTELIQNGINGYLFPVNDSAAAAERILNVLQHRSRALHMGQVGRRMVEANFTVQAMIDRLTTLYDGLLGIRPEVSLDWKSAAV